MWGGARSSSGGVAGPRADAGGNGRRRALVAMAVCVLALLAPRPGAAAGGGAAEDGFAQASDDIARVEAYLNRLTTIESRFIQVNPDGTTAQGTLYLQRPGRLRFEYDPPTPYMLIADGTWLAHIDRELEQTTYYRIEDTPAYFLLRPKISFRDGLAVTEVSRGPGVLRLRVIARDNPEPGAIVLVFADRPLALRKWVVEDAQGLQTEVTLIDARFGHRLDPALFEPPEPVQDEGQ